MKKQLTLLLFGFVVTLPCAFADTLLLPGTPIGGQAPDTDLVTTGLNLITQESGVITGAHFTSNYTEWVYTDTNVTKPCPSGGCLDFEFQFTDNGADVNDRVTLGGDVDAGFTGFAVDAGYVLGSGDAPSSVDRTDPSVIGFTDNVHAGETSALMIIQTNALSFDNNGTLSIQDGSASFNVAYEPIGTPATDLSSTPEPGTYGLIGLGLAGLGLLRRRVSVGSGKNNE